MQRFLAYTLVVLAAPAAADVLAPLPGVTMVRHAGAVMTIASLCAPGVSVRATRYAERQQTPEAWATGVGAQVAINADFFDFPGWSYILVRARGAGEEWPGFAEHLEQPSSYWQFGRGFAGFEPNSLVVPAAPPRVTEVVGAYDTLIVDGKIIDFTGQPFMLANYRRSAIGLSKDHRFLFFYASTFAINGPNMAAEMIGMAAEGGGPAIDFATNQDGGGSSQLYVQGYGQVITSGRQVNTHLGLYASGSGPSPNCNDVPDPFSLSRLVPPALPRRHVVNPAAWAAWAFDLYQDVEHLDDATLAAAPIGTDFPDAPVLLRGDGTPAVYLVDRGYRRHVPSAAVAVRWHLDLATVRVVPPTDLEAMGEVAPLPDRPWLVQGTGPGIYVVDDPAVPVPARAVWSGPASNLAPPALPAVGGAGTDRSVVGGCAQSAGGPQWSLLLLAMLGLWRCGRGSPRTLR